MSSVMFLINSLDIEDSVLYLTNEFHAHRVVSSGLENLGFMELTLVVWR